MVDYRHAEIDVDVLAPQRATSHMSRELRVQTSFTLCRRSNSQWCPRSLGAHHVALVWAEPVITPRDPSHPPLKLFVLVCGGHGRPHEGLSCGIGEKPSESVKEDAGDSFFFRRVENQGMNIVLITVPVLIAYV